MYNMNKVVYPKGLESHRDCSKNRNFCSKATFQAYDNYLINILATTKKSDIYSLKKIITMYESFAELLQKNTKHIDKQTFINFYDLINKRLEHVYGYITNFYRQKFENVKSDKTKLGELIKEMTKNFEELQNYKRIANGTDKSKIFGYSNLTNLMKEILLYRVENGHKKIYSSAQSSNSMGKIRQSNNRQNMPKYSKKKSSSFEERASSSMRTSVTGAQNSTSIDKTRQSRINSLIKPTKDMTTKILINLMRKYRNEISILTDQKYIMLDRKLLTKFKDLAFRFSEIQFDKNVNQQNFEETLKEAFSVELNKYTKNIFVSPYVLNEYKLVSLLHQYYTIAERLTKKKSLKNSNTKEKETTMPIDTKSNMIPREKGHKMLSNDIKKRFQKEYNTIKEQIKFLNKSKNVLLKRNPSEYYMNVQEMLTHIANIRQAIERDVLSRNNVKKIFMKLDPLDIHTIVYNPAYDYDMYKLYESLGFMFKELYSKNRIEVPKLKRDKNIYEYYERVRPDRKITTKTPYKKSASRKQIHNALKRLDRNLNKR